MIASVPTTHLIVGYLSTVIVRTPHAQIRQVQTAFTFAGYGITCVLEDGKVLEKAAANISVVRGTLSAQRAAAMSSRGRSSIDPKGGQPYAAAAMSLVFHSAHPLIPTLRADVRLFQVEERASGARMTRSRTAIMRVRGRGRMKNGFCRRWAMRRGTAAVAT
jgi:hypothetical protein